VPRIPARHFAYKLFVFKYLDIRDARAPGAFRKALRRSANAQARAAEITREFLLFGAVKTPDDAGRLVF
jgi:hypothetical protein